MENDLSKTDTIFSLLQEDVAENTNEKISNPYCIKSDEPALNEICFYKINLLTFDEEYPHREAFENVLQALDNDAFNFVYILDGDENGINLYIGVVRNQNENKPVLGKLMNAANYGKNIAGAFEGNFGGSVLEKIVGKNLSETVIDSSRQFKNAGVILGIPSVNDNDKSDKYGFQGIDRLINAMIGLKWRIVVVCEPVPKSEILSVKRRVYKIYNAVSPYMHQSLQQSSSGSKTFSDSTSTSKAESFNRSESNSQSDTRGRQNERTNSSQTTQKGDSFSEGTTNTSSQSKTSGVNVGKSTSMTLEVVDKSAKEIIDYIDEELLKRIKIGLGRRLFKTSIYYMGEKPTDAERLKIGIMSLFQGNNSSYSPLTAYPLDVECDAKILTAYQSFYVNEKNFLPERMTLLSRPNFNGRLGLNTYLTAGEVSLIAGLPQKEIPGIAVKGNVDFGLNFKHSDGKIFLGNLIHKGRELSTIPVKISDEVLNKHVFIAGVTGSGKTTTCQKLLQETNFNFLVIEPAKTEYRALINSPHFKNVIVFTVGDELTAPFRLNPFELVRGESVSSHADMLKATFTSAFPMEASMPQILEEAIYKIYEDKGWDVDTSRNFVIESRADYKKGDEFRADFDAFPMLSDFLKALEEIVQSKGFSDRLRDDYRGSLISRFSNLTKGSKGALFNCRRSINFERLIDQNVIIEMEDLKSSEDKSLLMGFILTRLSAVIKQRHKVSKNFRHITLIEEAHRLLSRVEFGDNGSKRLAVETFTDLLAEVRKYGESLIIVDQIPNKLAPEVLKNTNTKIIHRLFARDDKESVGDTMLMDDKQKEYLSALETGQAIVFSEGMSRPVHVKIQAATDTDDNIISDEVVRARFMKNFGEWYFSNEITNKFYRPTRDLLQKISAEYTKNFTLQAETIENINKLKSKIRRHCLSLIEDEFNDVDLTVEKCLAENFAKRNFKDKVFENRLENFLTLIFDEENFSAEKLPPNNEVVRFLIDVKSCREELK